jgi:O-antigen ligase
MSVSAPSTIIPAAFAGLFVAGVGASTMLQMPEVTAGIAVLALCVAIVAVIGIDGLGMAIMGVCFFMAPYFRAFPIVEGTAISVIDPLLVLAVLALFPRVIRGRLDVAPLYTASAFAFIFIGYVASLVAPDGANGFGEVTHWAFLAVVLGLTFMALDLTRTEVAVFSLLYIAGQMLSTVIALRDGPLAENNRYEGLAAHPNYFADGAMMSACLLLYLWHEPRARTLLMRASWWLVMTICMWAIYVSGSRGAALGMAAVIVLVPIVERSSTAVVLGTLALTSSVVVVQRLAANAAEGTTLARLTGSDNTGTATTEFRETSWREALQQIPSAPFFGHGLSLDVLSYHNIYLSIAAGLGVFALVAYLVSLWAMTRGLFGPSPERRLLYPMIAFAMFSLTQPSFKDRSNWLPMLLGIAIFHGYRYARRSLFEEKSAPEVRLPAGRGT